ncbi:hypothetical protein Vretimale_17849 [Volvox reticuliferus]|uniref:Uncharacterized protein n=1 Tax=Volvox reticuliferus TaxID=1737510 RepID=A0A8J4GVX9_9CHLO|nr:hypothetical protein Vretimale_17849 [Volvox reticuliferus]GIM15094.1 hypothetical protein Vretimale_17849 [Volvox reticuliferus]GIM15095.1 hypothetical protein Vretimale_17849 [Volvox reticuliferus]GIM15096.1 hypothetical protein Vretimale_17849 [Volvox reticuliferus]
MLQVLSDAVSEVIRAWFGVDGRGLTLNLSLCACDISNCPNVVALAWQIRLDNNTALILQYVVVQNFRETPLGQSPGFDIVASSLTEAGALIMMQDAILMLRKLEYPAG